MLQLHVKVVRLTSFTCFILITGFLSLPAGLLLRFSLWLGLRLLGNPEGLRLLFWLRSCYHLFLINNRFLNFLLIFLKCMKLQQPPWLHLFSACMEFLEINVSSFLVDAWSFKYNTFDGTRPLQCLQTYASSTFIQQVKGDTVGEFESESRVNSNHC